MFGGASGRPLALGELRRTRVDFWKNEMSWGGGNLPGLAPLPSSLEKEIFSIFILI